MEIKFRGMDVKGNWYYGNLAILKQNVNHVKAGAYISNSVGLPFAYEVRPETVSQYTGLKDKNGVEGYRYSILGGTFQGGYIDYCDRCKQFQYFGLDIGCMLCEGVYDLGDVILDINYGKSWFIGNKIENPGLVTKIVISRYNYEGKENPVDKSKEITITIKQLKDLFNFFLSGREGSFRYLIYDVMGFEPKDYCDLYNTNLIRFNNYFCELKEKAESFEKLQKDL